LHITEPPKDFNNGGWYTIDPGDNTARATWNSGQMLNCQTYPNCLTKIPKIADSIIHSVLIEGVEFWGTSSVSYASASSGDLIKLAFEVGTLIYLFRNNGFPVYIVSPKIWKGQLDYKQLRHILLDKFGIKTTNNHEASAIAIGLWAKGVF
jgi:hypothetical protein